MPRFPADDGTSLAYRTVGDGPPLVCLPGGPGQDSRYLDDLGGLSARRTLVLLDNRGTATPTRPRTPPATAWTASSTISRPCAASSDRRASACWAIPPGPAAPLGYGPWGAAAQAHAAAAPSQYRRAAHEGFYAGFTPDPAIPSRLAALTARVLVLGGEHDLWPTLLASSMH